MYVGSNKSSGKIVPQYPCADQVNGNRHVCVASKQAAQV